MKGEHLKKRFIWNNIEYLVFSSFLDGVCFIVSLNLNWVMLLHEHAWSYPFSPFLTIPLMSYPYGPPLTFPIMSLSHQFSPNHPLHNPTLSDNLKFTFLSTFIPSSPAIHLHDLITSEHACLWAYPFRFTWQSPLWANHSSPQWIFSIISVSIHSSPTFSIISLLLKSSTDIPFQEPIPSVLIWYPSSWS